MLEIPSPQDADPPAAFDDAIRQLSDMRDQGVGYVKFNSFNLLRAGADAKALDALRAASERCHGLGIKMIAACVEWGESLATLADLRIEFAQGFAIAPPRPMAKAFGR